jgi:hypothetical protein
MGCEPWGTIRRVTGLGLLMIAGFGLPGMAQMQVGSETSMSLNGQLGAGYADTFGNQTQGSSHGLFFTGLAQLSGFYHNPRFLNFNVQPFYNRSQDNSTFQSVLNDTGVEASVNLFSGSRFPGSVSYGAAWQTGSQFQIAGQPGLSANGNSQSFGVTWNAFIPNWPTLTATYSDNSVAQTIIGETGTTSNTARFLNLYSNYTVYGFQVNGFYSHQNFDATFPAFLTGTDLQSSSSGNSYGLSASHQLPLAGSVAFGASRFTYNSGDNVSLGTNGASDTAFASVSLNPTRKLTVVGTARYYDNLVGELQQQGTIPPGTVPISPINYGVSGVTVNSFASYNIGKGLVLVGYANRQAQHFQGQTFDSNQWGATLTYNYARPLFGLLYFSFGTVNTTGNGNQGTLGFVGNLGLKKKINGWDLAADISYAQNVQSSLALYNTSNYNYGGYLRKRFGEFTYWTASYREVQTGLTQETGYHNRSETALTTLSRRWIGVSGSYSQSNGTSILTTSGQLVPTPVPPLNPLDQIVYSGVAYGAGLSLNPVSRMVITANWFRVTNHTQSDLQTTNIMLFSNNQSDRVYAQLQYNVRKLILRSTYWRVSQLVSASGIPRTNVNTFSFSISRWFNFF